jgi:hypothetical protein
MKYSKELRCQMALGGGMGGYMVSDIIGLLICFRLAVHHNAFYFFRFTTFDVAFRVVGLRL